MPHPKVQEITVEYDLTPKQTRAFDLLTSLEEAAVCYGGAKGGGKSFLFCVWCYIWTQKLIELFKLPPQMKFPLPVGFIGRKRAVDFNKTTLETWKRTIPESGYIIRPQDKEIIIDGRAKLFYGGLDDQQNIEKFNSFESAFVAIDQAEETEKTELAVLEASLRLTYNGIRPPYKKLYTANPAECHLKYDYVKNNEQGSKKYFVPALPTDNKYLPNNYVDTLTSAFGHDPKLLRAYKDGDWDILLPTNALITYTLLDSLKGIERIDPVSKKIVAIDPATGGDECVMKVFYNTKEIEQRVFHERDTTKIAGYARVFGYQHGCNDFICDVIGVGKGVADSMVAMGCRVQYFNSSEQAPDPDLFWNLRAWAWWFVAGEMINKRSEEVKDFETRRQLVEPKYKIKTGRILMEEKPEVKKRLGVSPDRADCYVYGIYGLSQIQPNVTGFLASDQQDRQGAGYDADEEQQPVGTYSGY
jgi:hypothetical protein